MNDMNNNVDSTLRFNARTTAKLNAVAQHISAMIASDPGYVADRKSGETAYGEAYRSLGCKSNLAFLAATGCDCSSIVKTKKQRQRLSQLIAEQVESRAKHG